MSRGLEPLIVVGAGGHARTVIGVVLAGEKWSVAGLIVENGAKSNGTVLGVNLLGGLETLPELLAARISKAVVAVGDNNARQRLAEELLAAGFELATVVHPSAHIMVAAQLGSGSFVHASSVVGPECSIGRNVIIQPVCVIGHETVVGDTVQFCAGVNIGGKVRIGDRSFFGPGAVVYPGIQIGCDVSIGANTVINRDLSDGSVVVSTQARSVRSAVTGGRVNGQG
jgi:sugar O-acyltransferase (sialic acid O-acetyltransferase NeuD family)